MSNSDSNRSRSRRQFLRGVGGFSLGLPFLPSLLRAGAAQAAVPGRQRFIAITTDHGGISEANMLPAPSTLTDAVNLFAGHDARWGALTATDDGAFARMSPVLRAPKGILTPKLVSKLNVLTGLDIPFYIAHHWGGHLGNVHARADGGGVSTQPFQTIDQVMAYSAGFYPSLDGVKQRSIVAGQDFRGVSFGYSNPTAKTGSIQALKTETSSSAIFDRIFAGGVPTTPGPAPVARPKPVVDLVLEDYKRLRNGNRRLGGSDRRRLDEHMERMAELQRALTTTAPVPSLSCKSVTKPAEDSDRYDRGQTNVRGIADAKQYFKLLNKVLVQAMACGSTRIATVYVGTTFSDYAGNWHQDVAHRCTTPDAQKVLADAMQLMFENVFVDLVAQMDAVEDAPGTTLLDNTLVQWTQESGPVTHDAQPMPVVTAGSAGNYLKTGLFVDYRNKTKGHQLGVFGGPGPNSPYAGLLYRQWLATALDSMGVPRTDWARAGATGYGDQVMESWYSKAVVPGVIERAGDSLPFITRA